MKVFFLKLATFDINRQHRQHIEMVYVMTNLQHKHIINHDGFGVFFFIKIAQLNFLVGEASVLLRMY